MSQLSNWSRWHPWNPLFTPKKFVGGMEWLDFLRKNAKSFHDSDASGKGTIVHQRERAIQVEVTKYLCPDCRIPLPNRKETRKHLAQRHNFGREESERLARKAQEVKVTETLKDVDIYYEVIEPREIVPLPAKVEIPTDQMLNKGTLAPTPKEREKHDEEMLKWRIRQHGKSKVNFHWPFTTKWRDQYEEMASKTQVAPQRPEILRLFPNGKYSDSGPSGNWWYFAPFVWRQEAKDGNGAWLEPTLFECKHWAKVGLPKRVLYLLCIVKD